MHKSVSMEAFDLTPALIKTPVEMSFRRDAKQHCGRTSRGTFFSAVNKEEELTAPGSVI